MSAQVHFHLGRAYAKSSQSKLARQKPTTERQISIRFAMTLVAFAPGGKTLRFRLTTLCLQISLAPNSEGPLGRN